MPFAALIGGTIVPGLLMLSPLAVMAASHCTGWPPAAKVAKNPGGQPCRKPLVPLM